MLKANLDYENRTAKLENEKELENWRENVLYKIVPKNARPDCPAIPFCDLDIIFYLPIETERCVNAKLIISNDTAEFLGATADTLYSHAKENAPKKHKAKAFSLATDAMMKGIKESTVEDPDITATIKAITGTDPIVITTTDNTDGFCAVNYPEVKQALEEKYGEFYILPSSVHEALVMPKSVGEAGDLLQMVTTINKAGVAPADFLADNVYICKNSIITSYV